MASFDEDVLKYIADHPGTTPAEAAKYVVSGGAYAGAPEPTGTVTEAGRRMGARPGGAAPATAPEPAPGLPTIEVPDYTKRSAGAAPAAPGGPAIPGPSYAAPVAAAPASPSGTDPETSAAKAGFGAYGQMVDAVGARMMGGGSGGPPTTTTLKSSGMQYTPEQAALVEQALGEQRAAHERVGRTVSQLGFVQYQDAMKQAAEGMAQADFWNQRAAQEEQRVAAARAQTADILDQSKRAAAAFDEAAKPAPLGSVLNPNTAQKVIGVISLALGGFMQGFGRRGDNPALTQMNSAIDQELAMRRERRAELGGRMDALDRLMKSNLDAFGDERAADAATKATMLTSFGDRAVAMATLSGGGAELQRANVMRANLDAQAADLQSQAATALGTKVERESKIRTGGGGADPLTILRREQEIKALALKNAVEYGKAFGGSAGVDEQRLFKVGQEYERRGFDKYDAAARQVDATLKANGGRVPGRVAQFLSGVADNDKTSTWKDLAASALLSPEERQTMNAITNLIATTVYANTGKQVNDHEFNMVVHIYGLGKFEDPADFKAGLANMRKSVEERKASLRAQAPREYEAYSAGMHRALESMPSAFESNAPRP